MCRSGSWRDGSARIAPASTEHDEAVATAEPPAPLPPWAGRSRRYGPHTIPDSSSRGHTDDMRPFLTIVASLIAAVVVLWLVLLVCFAIMRPPGATLRDAVRIVPDAVRLVHRLARDKTLSRSVRVRLLLLLGYLAFPIDLVPDFIPVLGYADDAIVIGVVLRSVIRRTGPDIVRKHWPGSAEGLALLAQLCRIPALTPDHTS